jgi:multiple sugar transport system permease protein
MRESTTITASSVPWRRIKVRVLPYVLLSPAVAATLLIIFFPMIQAGYMSLHNYILWKPKAITLIWLDNYLRAFADEVFWISLKNTAIWIGATVPLQMILGLVTALLLNQQFPWRALARGLVIIPWALPSVVIGLMWTWIYNPNYGVLNDLMLRIGILQTAMPWLADPDTALFAVIVTLMWQGFPFFAVMFLAGLQAIPRSYYEAAELDGASTWQQFRHITLPGLKGVMVTALLLRTIWVANSIDVIYVMTGGGPGYNTHTLPLYSFIRTYTGMDFGYGSALAVTFTIMLLSIVIVYLRRVGRELR